MNSRKALQPSAKLVQKPSYCAWDLPGLGEACWGGRVSGKATAAPGPVSLERRWGKANHCQFHWVRGSECAHASHFWMRAWGFSLISRGDAALAQGGGTEADGPPAPS